MTTPANRQRQIAGANATQIQTNQLIINQGISRSEVEEIVRHEARLVVENYFAAGRDLAMKRMEEFGSTLIDLLADRGLLSAFADPGFQHVLQKAQLQAAISDHQNDEHNLLSELLAEKATAMGENKLLHMAVSRAVEAIETIDVATLTALTILWYTMETYPTTNDPYLALEIRDTCCEKLLAQLPTGELPPRAGWLESLSLMGLIHIDGSGFSKQHKFGVFTFRRWPGFVSRSLDETQANELRVRLNDVWPQAGERIVQHPLVQGRYRFNILTLDELDELEESGVLAAEARERVREIFAGYGICAMDDTAIDDIERYADSHFPNYAAVSKWWEAWRDRFSVNILAPGRALAYSNAQRIGLEFRGTDGEAYPLAELLEAYH